MEPTTVNAQPVLNEVGKLDKGMESKKKGPKVVPKVLPISAAKFNSEIIVTQKPGKAN